MLTFGGIISFAIAGAWAIIQVVLALVVVYCLYYMVFSFICAIWSTFHETSYLFVKAKVKGLFNKKEKTKVS